MVGEVGFSVIAKVDNKGISAILNSPTGPLSRHLHRVGRRIVSAARGQVGKATLSLMGSISYDVDMVGGLPKLTVSATDEIAMIHHEGTRPHAIQARGSHAMRFSSNGRIVYSRAVMHPGTPANRFLSDNLYIAKG